MFPLVIYVMRILMCPDQYRMAILKYTIISWAKLILQCFFSGSQTSWNAMCSKMPLSFLSFLCCAFLSDYEERESIRGPRDQMAKKRTMTRFGLVHKIVSCCWGLWTLLVTQVDLWVLKTDTDSGSESVFPPTSALILTCCSSERAVWTTEMKKPLFII